jgi:dimethylamine corrinoid protein
MFDYEKLKEAMGDLEENSVIGMLKDVMKAGGGDAEKAMEACSKGMEIIGSRFDSGEYFVSDLVYAGELMRESVEILKDALIGSATATNMGKMILCTVKGDLHDIGKNIVKAMLVAGGFEVIDLGIDVDPKTIVDTAKKENIKIIALSGVLTLAIDAMGATIKAFAEANERGNVKIIIGGNPVNENVCALIGADEWAHSPQKTVDICKKWAAV